MVGKWFVLVVVVDDDVLVLVPWKCGLRWMALLAAHPPLVTAASRQAARGFVAKTREEGEEWIFGLAAWAMAWHVCFLQTNLPEEHSERIVLLLGARDVQTCVVAVMLKDEEKFEDDDDVEDGFIVDSAFFIRC